MKVVVPFLLAIAATLLAIGLTIALARTRPVELQGWKASLDRWLQQVLESQAEVPEVTA